MQIERLPLLSLILSSLGLSETAICEPYRSPPRNCSIFLLSRGRVAGSKEEEGAANADRPPPVDEHRVQVLIISQKGSIKSLRKSQFPHKSVNLSFIITNIKNTMGVKKKKEQQVQIDRRPSTSSVSRSAPLVPLLEPESDSGPDCYVYIIYVFFIIIYFTYIYMNMYI